MDDNYVIKRISHSNIIDINVANQSFNVFGKMVPIFDGKTWTFTETLLEKPFEHIFPNEEMDYTEYIDNPNKMIIFIYKNNQCLGQIIIRSNWNGFCYIEDISVGIKYRGQGVGSKLLDSAEVWAKERGLKGFMLEAQDFNLGACRMYHKYGFILGSADNMLYYNTENKEDLALFWYKVF